MRHIKDVNKLLKNFYSFEHEEYILGTIILDNEKFEEVNKVLSSKDFSCMYYEEIYKCITELHFKKISFDILSLIEYIKEFKENSKNNYLYENINGFKKLIIDVVKDHIKSDNIKYHLEAMKEKSLFKQSLRYKLHRYIQNFQTLTIGKSKLPRVIKLIINKTLNLFISDFY